MSIAQLRGHYFENINEYVIEPEEKCEDTEVIIRRRKSKEVIQYNEHSQA